MKVSELIEQLTAMPLDAEVVSLTHCCSGCYGEHSPVEEVVLEQRDHFVAGTYYPLKHSFAYHTPDVRAVVRIGFE